MNSGNYWNDIFWTRVSRRRLLQTGAVAGVGLGIAAACGGGGNDGGAAPTETADQGEQGETTEEAKPGGRYLAAVTVNFDGLDPHLSIAAGPAILPRLYNGLLRTSARVPDTIIMDLAESYETPDDTTYSFKIRPNVKIAANSFGIPERALDAQDALASFQRIANTDQANLGAFVKNYGVTFEAPNNETFVLKTATPYAWTVEQVGSVLAGIVPREAIQQNIDLHQQAVGGGPYTLTTYRDNELVRIDKNPTYWDQPYPHLDGIDYAVIADRSARRAALLSQQIYEYTPENKAEADELVRQEANLELRREPSVSYVSFIMNPEVKPFDDPRVRRAISRAINRTQYIQTIEGGEAQPTGLVTWSLGDYALPEDELNSEYQPYDPDEAKSLLSDAGHEDGLTIPVIYPSHPTIDNYVPILLAQFEAAGIKMDQQPLDFTTWLERYRTRDYPSSISLNQVYETPETPLNFHTSAGPIGDGSYSVGLKDEEIDEAVRKANTTIDVEARIEAVREAQRLIYEKDPVMLNFYTGYTYLTLWNFVKNRRTGIGTLYLAYNDVWLDK